MCEMANETGIIRRFCGEVGSVLLTGKEGGLLGSRAAIGLDQFPARSIERAAPQAYRFSSQLRVGHFQHNAANVFIRKEIITGELEIVQGPFHVEEEWI